MNRRIAIDLETVPDPFAASLLPAPEADKRLKDPDKIKADIERKRIEQISSLAVKPNKNLIVCAGWCDGEKTGSVYLPLGGNEGELLREFWALAQSYDMFYTFNGLGFDVPTLNIHSARHRIRPSVRIDCGRYRVTNHLDCYAVLSHWNPTMGGGLDYYMRYFGLSSGKEGMNGKKVAGLYNMGSAGEMAIRKYCEKDCRDTFLLAEYIREYMIF